VPSNQQQQPVTPNSNYWNHSPPGTLNHPSHRSANDSGNKHAGGYYSHGPPHGGGHTNGHSHSSSYRYEDDVNGGFDSGNQPGDCLENALNMRLREEDKRLLIL